MLMDTVALVDRRLPPYHFQQNECAGIMVGLLDAIRSFSCQRLQF